MELDKLESHARRGHMGAYSAQMLELIGMVKERDADLAFTKSALDAQGKLTTAYQDIALASQPAQPVVTVDTPEFRELLADLLDASEQNQVSDSYGAARAPFIAHIDAHLAKAVAAKESEILAVHRKLAAETLRADQGWSRYEAANKSKNALEAVLAAAPQPAQAELSDEQIEALRSIADSWMSQDGRDSVEDWIATIIAASQQPSLPIVLELPDGDTRTAKVAYVSIIDGKQHICITVSQQPADAAPVEAVPNVNTLAQFIRSVDGNHSLGAGALAEKIVEWFASQPTPAQATPAKAVDERAAFEIWAKPMSHWRVGDTYTDLHTSAAWEAWQARAALAAPSEQVKS